MKPRSEAPRREITLSASYQPAKFIKIYCHRGQPISIFFVQVYGIPVPGLTIELQRVCLYLQPLIISNMRDMNDPHLALLQDIAARLTPLLPHLRNPLPLLLLHLFLTLPLLATRTTINHLPTTASPATTVTRHLLSVAPKARLRQLWIASNPNRHRLLSSRRHPRRARAHASYAR